MTLTYLPTGYASEYTDDFKMDYFKVQSFVTYDLSV